MSRPHLALEQPSDGASELVVISPPYTAIDSADKIPESISEGTVVGIGLNERYVQRTVRIAEFIRRRHPGAVLGGFRSGSEQPQAPPAILHRSTVRLILCREPTIVPALVAAAGFQVSDIEPWLRIVLRPKTVVEVGVVSMLPLVLAGEGLTMPVANEVDRCLGRLGLPTLQRWRRAGALVRGLVHLQQFPECGIRAGARVAGYADAPSFGHSFRRVFGLPPGRARHLCGWEWTLDRFLKLPG